MSILDLNADLDLALDVAAPIDLAVAANANVAAPDRRRGRRQRAVGRAPTAQALGDQGVMIDQGITGDATADAPQDSAIDTGDGGTAGAGGTDGGARGRASALPTMPRHRAGAPRRRPGGPAHGDLPTGTGRPATCRTDELPSCPTPEPPDVGCARWTATCSTSTSTSPPTRTWPRRSTARSRPTPTSPRPIDAAVAANIGSIDSEAIAVAQQDAIITQDIDGDATADADQDVRHRQPVTDDHQPQRRPVGAASRRPRPRPRRAAEVPRAPTASS